MSAKEQRESEKSNIHSVDNSNYKLGYEKRESVLDVYRSFTGDIFKIFEFILICLIIICAIFSIYNISARETLSKSIEQKINDLNSQFVTTNKMVLSGKLTSDDQTDVTEQLNEIAKLERLSSHIEALKAYGGSSEISLIKIKSEFVETKETLLLPSEPIDNGKVPITIKPTSIDSLMASFSYFSSDILLAFALLSCSALGAVIASLRSNNNVDLSKFTIGFATGFITYLGIKGGQFVFLLQVPGAAAVLNPYTASFLGLISGMFSERVHLMLSDFIEKAANKINSVDSGN